MLDKIDLGRLALHNDVDGGVQSWLPIKTCHRPAFPGFLCERVGACGEPDGGGKVLKATAVVCKEGTEMDHPH